jgi:hypothetical protein
MKVYAFDVDETLSIAGGPVTVDQLVELRKRGDLVFICGNWAKFVASVNPWIHVVNGMNIGAPSKHLFLQEIKRYISAEEYVLVGNEAQGDYLHAQIADWVFVEARNFKEGLK